MAGLVPPEYDLLLSLDILSKRVCDALNAVHPPHDEIGCQHLIGNGLDFFSAYLAANGPRVFGCGFRQKYAACMTVGRCNATEDGLCKV